jgi:hypothetical protein
MVIEHVCEEPAHRLGPGAGGRSWSELHHGVTTRPPLDAREARS